MITNEIRLKDLSPDNLNFQQLWVYTPSKDGELWIKPAKKNHKLGNKIIPTMVNFNDGTSHSALIEGIDIELPEFSKHNRKITIWIESYGWFALALYNDSEAYKDLCGDLVLSKLCHKTINQIFPIYFDLRKQLKIDDNCLFGYFEHNPTWGITSKEKMKILMNELSKT